MAGRREERFESTLALRLDKGRGIARNVSANGIYFVTDVALQEGAPFSFTLDFDNYPGGALRVKCAARVIRVEVLDDKLGVGAAISSMQLQRAGGDGE